MGATTPEQTSEIEKAFAKLTARIKYEQESIRKAYEYFNEACHLRQLERDLEAKKKELNRSILVIQDYFESDGKDILVNSIHAKYFYKYLRENYYSKDHKDEFPPPPKLNSQVKGYQKHCFSSHEFHFSEEEEPQAQGGWSRLKERVAKTAERAKEAVARAAEKTKESMSQAAGKTKNLFGVAALDLSQNSEWYQSRNTVIIKRILKQNLIGDFEKKESVFLDLKKRLSDQFQKQQSQFLVLQVEKVLLDLIGPDLSEKASELLCKLRQNHKKRAKGDHTKLWGELDRIISSCEDYNLRASLLGTARALLADGYSGEFKKKIYDKGRLKQFLRSNILMPAEEAHEELAEAHGWLIHELDDLNKPGRLRFCKIYNEKILKIIESSSLESKTKKFFINCLNGDYSHEMALEGDLVDLNSETCRAIKFQCDFLQKCTDPDEQNGVLITLRKYEAFCADLKVELDKEQVLAKDDSCAELECDISSRADSVPPSYHRMAERAETRRKHELTDVDELAELDRKLKAKLLTDINAAIDQYQKRKLSLKWLCFHALSKKGHYYAETLKNSIHSPQVETYADLCAVLLRYFKSEEEFKIEERHSLKQRDNSLSTYLLRNLFNGIYAAHLPGEMRSRAPLNPETRVTSMPYANMIDRPKQFVTEDEKTIIDEIKKPAYRFFKGGYSQPALFNSRKVALFQTTQLLEEQVRSVNLVVRTHG